MAVDRYRCITEEVKDFIRSGKAEGMTQRQIADRLGTGNGTVSAAFRQLKLSNELAVRPMQIYRQRSDAEMSEADADALTWAAGWAKL